MAAGIRHRKTLPGQPLLPCPLPETKESCLESSHFNLPGGHRLGFEPVAAGTESNDRALTFRLDWRPAIDAGRGDAHRIHHGMLTAFADTVCGITNRYSFGDEPMITATLELAVELLADAAPHERVTATGECVYASANAAHLACTLEAGGDALARAHGIFSLGPPTQGRSTDLATMFQDVPSAYELFDDEPEGFRDFLGFRFADGEGSVAGGDHLIGNPIIRAYHGGLSAAILACTAEDLVAGAEGGAGFRFLSQRTQYLRPTSVDRPLVTRGRIAKIGKRYATVVLSGYQDDSEVVLGVVTLQR